MKVEKRKSVEAELGVKSSRLCENVTPCAGQIKNTKRGRDGAGAIATKKLAFKHASLFSGIGGFDLAAEWMGWTNTFQCEINDWCRLAVLAKHFPQTTKYADIRKTDFTIWRNRIDILTGGVPCQPFSVAGKQRGTEDERFLWHEFIRAIREIQPAWFVAENVSGLLSTNGGAEYEKIIVSMEAENYETLTLHLPACAFGAEHIRKRVWIIGYSKLGADTYTARRELGKISDTIQKERTQDCSKLFGNITGLSWFQAISRVHGIFNGLSRRLDGRRNAALGNAIVPDGAYEIFKAIEQCEALKSI